MKAVLSFFIFILFVTGIAAQKTVLASNNKIADQTTVTLVPVVIDDALLLKEAEFNFGKIPQGKPVTHIFEVTNNGKDSLHIANVQASCGCTTPEWDRDKVQAPGEKTTIRVGYNAASEGPFAKTITITFNGTQSKQITIRGEVWKTPVNSAPENSALGSLKD